MASSAPVVSASARAPALALLAFAALFALALGCAAGQDAAAPPPTSPPNARTVAVNMADCSGADGCAFSPSNFEFRTGETVRFRLVSESEFHTFTISGLGIDEAVNARETRYLDVTFDRPGEYALICVPHESLGMKGAIAVR